MNAIKNLHYEWYLNMIMSKFSKLLGECKFHEKFRGLFYHMTNRIMLACINFPRITN